MLKHENSPRIPFIVTSVDDWMDEKKKVEGAEGLWRIHDKLYDFTVWSRVHPGGKFWIDITRGTDITEVFETHHLTNEAELLLPKYYVRESSTSRNYFTTFNENEFYRIFKRKASQLAATDEYNLNVHLLNDCLAAAVFLTGLLGIKCATPWIIVCGMLLGVLSVSSHSFFHLKKNWRINYFNLSLMSSRDWRIRHVLSHHQYRNTISDLEIPIWNWFSKNHKILGKNFGFVANLLMFLLASHVQFLQRWGDVFFSKKLRFDLEESVGFSLPLVLFLFGNVSPWEVFVKWNLIIMIASFCFCLFGSNFFAYSTQIDLEESSQRRKEDFGITQLSLLGNRLNINNSMLSFLNSFRGNALHYLCPRMKCGILDKFIPVVEDTTQEVGISCIENSEQFFEKFENKIPKGHIFFG